MEEKKEKKKFNNIKIEMSKKTTNKSIYQMEKSLNHENNFDEECFCLMKNVFV